MQKFVRDSLLLLMLEESWIVFPFVVGNDIAFIFFYEKHLKLLKTALVYVSERQNATKSLALLLLDSNQRYLHYGSI